MINFKNLEINTHTLASEVANEAAKKTEGLILAQISDFVKRGLIELELGPMTMVTSDNDPYKIEMRQKVALRLKDKEYIEKIEAENLKFKQSCEARLISQDLKLKDLKDMADTEEKAVDFIAQELIRVDRELAKLRPVTRLVMPKGIFDEKEAKKKSKTTH